MKGLMQALRFHGRGDIRVEQIPAPQQPGPDEVLVRIRAAGICGSDIHNFQTGQWISMLPVTPGHELCGEVMAVGSQVTGLLPGQKVVADSKVSCGECEACRRGVPNLCSQLGFVGEVCEGGFAQRLCIRADLLYPVAADIPDNVAVLAEPLSVALRAVKRLDPVAGEPVLVTGGGTIGGLAALLLNHRYGCPVLLLEKNKQRCELLHQVTGAIPVTPEDLQKQSRPPYYCLEATGSAKLVNRIVPLLSAGARMSLVGLFHDPVELDMNAVVERELELCGSSAFAGEMPAAIAMLPELAERLAKLVSAPVPLHRAPEAYEALIRGESGKLKTILIPEPEL